MRMPRPIRLALASLCLAAATAAQAPSPARPNILFLFSDDHAPQAISAYPGGLFDEIAPTPTSTGSPAKASSSSTRSAPTLSAARPGPASSPASIRI